MRAQSCARADCGVPCAPDHSGERAESYAGAGARAEPYTGADYGPPCASNHSGFEAIFWKVFTVEMPPLHVHQAYHGDYVVFNIKGLDKHNMPRSGDVMVPAFQIQEQTVDVGGSGIVREIPEEKVVERKQDSTVFVGAQHGPLQESRPEESSTTFCGSAGPRHGQRGQPLPPELVAERAGQD